MDNTEKLLRAFIEAQGYEVKEDRYITINVIRRTGVDINPVALTDSNKTIISKFDYKVTKKTRGGIKCTKCGTHLYRDAPLDSCLCKKPDNLIRYD